MYSLGSSYPQQLLCMCNRQGFVGILDTPAVVLVWDQFFMQCWNLKSIEDFCLSVVFLLRDKFMMASDYSSMRQVRQVYQSHWSRTLESQVYLSHGSRAQIYGSCRPSQYPELQSRISTCIDHVAEWMRSNRLPTKCGEDWDLLVSCKSSTSPTVTSSAPNRYWLRDAVRCSTNLLVDEVWSHHSLLRQLHCMKAKELQTRSTCVQMCTWVCASIPRWT